MRRLALVTFLFLAAPAIGGGFATTGLSSMPDGTSAGEPWVVTIDVRQHGVSPTDGLKPAITIYGNGTNRRFAAKPLGDGKYRAEVVFPSAGTWKYEVDNGFGYGVPAEEYPPVHIAEADDAVAAAAPARSTPAAPAPGDDGPPWLTAILAGLAAAGITVLALRRRPRNRTRTEPVATP
jgi:hypothetical protein